MSTQRGIKKQTVSKTEMMSYLDRGPEAFCDDIMELISDCQTLFNRMFDLYNECLGAKIAQLRFHYTITVGDELCRKLLTKNDEAEICDWQFGSSGLLTSEEAKAKEAEYGQ